ncbi:hypothetical protein AYO45_03530 [Gammaproteobacteria bacterium SCGC AG-212-F23]|nr:hypothetical protein AYO45_03530 [Gammaproteobacteria bacterium SCGC AG-212-F23]
MWSSWFSSKSGAQKKITASGGARPAGSNTAASNQQLQTAAEANAETQLMAALAFVVTGIRDTDLIISAYLGTDFSINDSYSTAKLLLANPNPTLFTSQLPTLIIQKFVRHGVFATAEDIQEIKKMLDAPLSQKTPDLNHLRWLLCTPATVTDHCSVVRKDRTLCQNLFADREYNVTSQKGNQVVDGLIEIVKPFFDKLPEGQALLQQQYDAQFPAGTEAKEVQRAKNDSDQLKLILKKLRETSDNDCQQTMALDSFHGYDLCPAAWAANDNEVLASAIYLKEEKDKIECRFRGLDGSVKTKSIPHPCSGKDVISVENILNNKHKYLPTLLEQLTEPGQFYTTEQIKKLKALSHNTVTAKSVDAFDTAWDELQKYIKSIVGETVNLDLLKTLYQFRHYAEPKGDFTTGYYSNPQFALEAYQSYDNNFEPFGNHWSAPKNVFSVQKIMGIPQRGLPAGELQLHAQGPYSVLVNGDKLKRTFSFTLAGGSILPVDSDPSFRLGYNYMAAGGVVLVAGPAPLDEAARFVFGILISSKNISATKITRQPGQQSSQGCALM